MSSKINIGLEIERLLGYALANKFIDSYYSYIIRNRLLNLFKLDEPYSGTLTEEQDSGDINSILNNILLYCYEEGILPDSTVTQRDLLNSKIMGFITPEPAKVIKQFNSAYYVSPLDATDYLYNLCLDVNYIHSSRIGKSFYWDEEESYGRLELVNSFFKPEKTAEEIEKRDSTQKAAYPRCKLCIETMGFAGDLWHEGKQNQRIVPLTLAGKQFYMHFSREQYYNERFFVAYEKHEKIDDTEKIFSVMLEFVDKFPHCFIGHEAELPGISSDMGEHCYFEGGVHVFPIEVAESEEYYRHELFNGVEASILNWPVSVIRLESGDSYQLIKVAAYIDKFWSDYVDESLNILPHTINGNEKTQHNAVASIARKNSRGCFELDIALRNNRADEKNKNGVFGCPEEYEHLRLKEVGLTAVMGLAVFPSSFDSEMLHIISHLMKGKKYELGTRPILDGHFDWINFLIEKYGTVDNYETARNIICYETGRRYSKILESCGVFKINDNDPEEFKDFMEDLGFIRECEELL